MIVTTTCAEQPSADDGNSSEQPSADEGFEGMWFATTAAPTTVTGAFFPAEGLQLPNAVNLDFLIAFFESVDAFFAEARSEDEDEDVVRACKRFVVGSKETVTIDCISLALGNPYRTVMHCSVVIHILNRGRRCNVVERRRDHRR